MAEDLLTVSQSLLEKSDETKKRPASQLDILDSSKRMKHQLEPIATTILDIFDNSDSELSDLSLHSSLLNSPISPGTPLEAVGGKPKMNESKSSNSRKPKAALKEIHVPLINPFFLKSNSYHSKDATLDSDLALIKSSSPFSKPLKYQTHVSINRSPPKSLFQSHDNCSACLGHGRLLCCSTCPRVFHFNCVEEGFGPDNEPDDQWKCKSCVCKSKSLKGVAASQYPNKFFKDLLVQMDSINPRVFELPRKIRNRYSNVFSHPLTGEFVSFKDVVIKNCLYMPPRKSIIQANQEPSAIPGDIKEVPKCYRCCKTDFKIAQTSFLNSNTIPDSVNGKLQSQRSELIQCDYCLLYWHLDCLDPPLTCIPPELSKTPPLLDLVDQQRLKMNIWNGSHPLDPRFISVNIPKEPLVKEHLTTEDLQRLYSSPPDSPFLEANKFIRIRKKWMCPCHVDWNVMKSKPEVSTSKRPIFKLHYKEGDQSKPASDVTANLLCKENDNSNTSSTPEVGGGPAVTEATKRKEIQTKNKVKKMPNVIIQNTPETIQYFEHPKKIPTAIPEHRVQLNFLSSCNTIEDTSLTMNPVLDAKFREFGNQFTTKVAELYKNTSKQIQKGKESSNEKIVETLLETENVKELDLRDYAASMLLFQLDIMSRFMEKHLSSD